MLWRGKHFKFSLRQVHVEPLAPGRVRCPLCNRQFRQGFPFSHHKALCALRHGRPEGASGGGDATSNSEEEHHPDCDAGLCEEHHPDNTPIHQSRQHSRVRAFEQHLSSAQSAPGCTLACASWGPRKLTAAEVETFRFLAVSDAGDGTSRRVATGVLQCARSLGGRACLLPQSMDTSWAMLTKVRHDP
jgi:hypothetical protein